jgi:RNA polymerase sigma-70 factor (ECF subfamily)
MQSKDDDCFAVLHERHHKALAIFLTKFVEHDEALAEDIIQQTFMQFVERIDQYDTSQMLRPYLFSIAGNLALDKRKYQSRHPAFSLSSGRLSGQLHGPGRFDGHPDFDPQDCGCDQPEDILALGERREFLAELLTYLSDEDREAVNAAYYDGLSFSDAAQALGIPVGTFKTRINRSLRKLRNLARRQQQEAA